MAAAEQDQAVLARRQGLQGLWVDDTEAAAGQRQAGAARQTARAARQATARTRTAAAPASAAAQL